MGHKKNSAISAVPGGLDKRFAHRSPRARLRRHEIPHMTCGPRTDEELHREAVCWLITITFLLAYTCWLYL
jgi:hypothetical protein